MANPFFSFLYVSSRLTSGSQILIPHFRHLLCSSDGRKLAFQDSVDKFLQFNMFNSLFLELRVHPFIQSVIITDPYLYILSISYVSVTLMSPP